MHLKELTLVIGRVRVKTKRAWRSVVSDFSAVRMVSKPWSMHSRTSCNRHLGKSFTSVEPLWSFITSLSSSSNELELELELEMELLSEELGAGGGVKKSGI